MQLVDMQGRITERLGEAQSGATYYPPVEQTAALNEGQRLFCLLTLALEETVAWNAPGYAANGNSPFYSVLSIAPDWIAPLYISTPGGAKLRPATMEELTAADSQWVNMPAKPTRYVMDGPVLLGLYGQPAVSTPLNVKCARAPVPLVNGTDVPEIPEEYHPELINFAINRLRQVEGGQEFAKTLDGLNSFLDAAGRYADYVRARNKGFRYDTQPFELANFDRSQLLTQAKT